MQNVSFLSGDIGRSGGTERATTVIANALAERNFNVSILSFSRGEASYFPLNPKVKLYSFHMERHSANLSDVRIWWRLHHFFKQHAVELVVDVDTIVSYYSIPAAIGTETQVISWEHFHLFINVGDIYQRLRRTVGRKLAARFARALVTLTEKDRQQYLQHMYCRVPIVTIPNPITITHNERSTLCTKVVLAAGRLVPEKGFDLLLQAWAIVWQLHPDWRLRIVGSGAEEDELKCQIKQLSLSSAVDLLPHTQDMVSQFKAASIYALSSRFEGFGLVLLEAKSFGIPIVSFDCGCGPSDIVRHGIDGILVAKEDVVGLANALSTLIRDETLRFEFGDQAHLDNRFALENIILAWEQLFD